MTGLNVNSKTTQLLEDNMAIIFMIMAHAALITQAQVVILPPHPPK